MYESTKISNIGNTRSDECPNYCSRCGFHFNMRPIWEHV